MIFLRIRWCLFAIAGASMLAGASGRLSPGLSTALWLPSLLMLACDPSSPLRRVVGRGLHIPAQCPQVLVRSGTSLPPDAAAAAEVGAATRADRRPVSWSPPPAA